MQNNFETVLNLCNIMYFVRFEVFTNDQNTRGIFMWYQDYFQMKEGLFTNR